MDWHDKSCTRPYIESFGDVISCLSCGSIGELTTERTALSPPFALPPIRQLSEIRTLRVLPGDFDSPIHCEISTKTLSPQAEYDAISYTWADESGDASKCKTVSIWNQPFAVTRNCENALRRVRNKFSPRDVWIDAICIDQENVDERGHQVQLMPRIYSTARKVFIYVGESADDSSQFLGMLLSGHFLSGLAMKFLSRRYFSRVWTLQEAALARQVTLLCGEVSMPWNKLHPANLGLLHGFSSKDDISLGSILPPVIYFNHRTYSVPDQLLNLLDLARACNTEDPRDKVFALLGLIPGGNIGGLEADYNLTVEEVYIRVALYLASIYGWTAVLFRAGTRMRSLQTLPSWVPDWSFVDGARDKSEFGERKSLEAVQYDENGKGEIRLKLIEIGRLWQWHAWDPNVARLADRYLCFRAEGSLHLAAKQCYESYCDRFDYRLLWGNSAMPMGIITTEMLDLEFSESDPTQELIAAGASVDRAEPQRKDHWCCIPLEAAVQIFTMFSEEIIARDILYALDLEMYQPLVGDDDIDLRKNTPFTISENVRVLTRLLSLSQPADTEMEGLWQEKFDRGELGALGHETKNSRNQAQLEEFDESVSHSPGTKEGVYDPIFRLMNDTLWRVLVRNFLLKETTIVLH